MTKNFLVTASNGWADEFTAKSFCIFEDTTLEAVEETVKKIIAEGVYFGTNEGWEEDELYSDEFEILEISQEEVTVLKKFFPSGYFGTGVFTYGVPDF